MQQAPLSEQFAELKSELRDWRLWRTLLAVQVGLLIFTTGFNGIVMRHQFFVGGLTGMAQTIYYFWPKIGIGYLYLLFNIPMFLLGWRGLSLKFVFISGVGMFMASFTLEWTHFVHIPIEDNLTAAITAGLWLGVGSGFYFRFGGSAGGLDILASWVRKRFALPLSTTFNLFNALVLVGAGVMYGYQVAFYSGILLFCYGWMIQNMISGFGRRSAVFIITDRPEAVTQEIARQMGRGATFLHGEGVYSQTPKKVIFTLMNLQETGRLKEIVYLIDPNALITLLNTDAVIGRQFLTWEEAGFPKPKPPIE